MATKREASARTAAFGKVISSYSLHALHQLAPKSMRTGLPWEVASLRAAASSFSQWMAGAAGTPGTSVAASTGGIWNQVMNMKAPVIAGVMEAIFMGLER